LLPGGGAIAALGCFIGILERKLEDVLDLFAFCF
jgi:hypothetical protein